MGVWLMQAIRLRLLESPDEHRALERIQVKIWGQGAQVVFHQTYVACRYGGVAVGAFEGEAMIGFCYGFPATDGTAVWLHSHMLGVLPAHRKGGLGARLKEAQRHETLRRGLKRMTWTFDPLEAPNARLNLGKLGGTVSKYLVDYYGDLGDALNRGIPSDRMLVEWDLQSPQGGQLPPPGAPLVNPTAGEWAPDLTHAALRVSAPPDMRSQFEAGNRTQVLTWRLQLRAIFQHYLGRGYQVTGFHEGAYLLQR